MAEEERSVSMREACGWGNGQTYRRKRAGRAELSARPAALLLKIDLYISIVALPEPICRNPLPIRFVR